MNKKILLFFIPMIVISNLAFASDSINLNNTITKTIEIRDEKELNLIEKNITYNEETYSLISTIKEEIDVITKEVEETKEIELETDDKSIILNNFEKTITFNDGEYSGELKCDEETLEIVPISHGTYTKVLTLEKEYSNLDSADLNSIPKEISNKNIRYILTDCNWSVIETENIANVTVPKKYKANSIYKAVKKFENPYTYKCSIIYKGKVVKEQPETIKYTLTYKKDIKENNKAPILPILGSTGAFILIVFLVFPNAKIVNYYDGKYKTLRYIKVFSKNPKVNLKYFPNAKSNVFSIHFNKNITEKLKGEFVTIVMKKGIVRKMIINNKIDVNI